MYRMPVWSGLQHHAALPCQIPHHMSNRAHVARHQATSYPHADQSSRMRCHCAQDNALTTTTSFDYQLQQLSHWKSMFGSCYVPSSASDASNLAAWAQWARRAAKKGQLTAEQQQQLDVLGFIWKPNVVDAKWHHQYHCLRCLLDTGSITLDELAQHHHQHQHQQYSEQEPNLQQQQQQQQQRNEEIHELSSWLARQVELYGKLKLTPVKVQLLRKLGVRLHRQPGLTKDNLHPVLKGQDPSTYQRRPIVVDVVTQTGKATVAKLLLKYQNWQQQQQQQQQPQQPQQQQQAVHGDGVPRQQQQFQIGDPQIAFIYRLAELQRWRKKYGSCYVPADVFDHQQLAAWVQQLRQVNSSSPMVAPAAVAAAGNPQAAADAVGGSREVNSSSSSSSSSSTASAPADSGGHPRQMVMLTAAAAAVPSELQAWHSKELNATGFVWKPNMDEEAWHEQYHRLRHFKHIHHNIKLPAVGTLADYAQFVTTSSSSSSSRNDWTGLAEWLQQQQHLLAMSAWGVSANVADSSQISGDKMTGSCGRPLTKLQRRLLKDLGVQPAAGVQWQPAMFD